MTEHGYRNLNTSVLKQITKVLEQDPAADLEAVLKRVYTPYAEFRQLAGSRQKKDRKVTEICEEDSPPPQKPRTVRALLPFTSCLQSQPLPSELCLLEGRPSPPSVLFSCALPHDIIYPLSPAARDLLGLTDGSSLDLPSMVICCAFSGKPIWEGLSRAVIQVSENVVVKVAQALDPDEHGVLQFLEERLPEIPVPRALGLVKVGNTSFMFMTLIPGTTLETHWPLLFAEAKTHIQCILDKHYLALRQLELPGDVPLGSPVGRCACKDVRRNERVSASPLYSESEFNDFLLHSPLSRAAPSYTSWLRSMLLVDHHIVFTHADLHPRNIIVVDGPDSCAVLSSIIDWESSGYYPEYWEHLKAMKTRLIKDTSDWWDHLPPSILGYDHDLVLDQVIEFTLVY